MFFNGNVPQVVGHRGWPTRFPDNTMAGMALAFGVVAMVETDVRRTNDGQLILSHDPAVDGLVVADTDWSVLSRIDLGAGQRLILLSEALAAFPDRSFNLEVKNSPAEPGFEPDSKLALEVAAASRTGDLLSSFFWPAMDLVKERHPDLATGLLLDEPVALELAISHAVERGHSVVIPNWELLMTPAAGALVDAAHAAGIGVATWTVNDTEVAIGLAAIGVDAIITNEPQLMMQAIEEAT